MGIEQTIFHPGVYVRDELTERGWSWGSFAERLGWSLDNVTLLLECRIAVAPTMASDLAQVLGTSELLWLRLQRSYDQGSSHGTV